MRCTAFVIGVLLASSVLAPCAEAQPPPSLSEENVEEVELPSPPPSYLDARLVADAGMGLTLGGLGTVGIGIGLFFLPYAITDLIAASTVLGVGGAAVLAGIPIWIAGGVRAAITAHRFESARAREAHDWEMAGLAVFCIAMGIVTVGAGLLGGAMASQYHSYSERLALAGGMLVLSGMGLGALIGSPMWAEGTRF